MAAELQRRHQLEGAPDPFPSLTEDLIPTKVTAVVEELDTGSHTAFPSLAHVAPAPSAPAKSVWGAAAGPRIKPTVIRQQVFSDSFTLSTIDLSSAGKDGKPATLGEVLKQIMAKYKVKVDASANQIARQTTFHMKADTQKELDKAKRSLLALLSPVITHVVNAPASTIGTVIGPKGATLKQIRDQTSVKIDIPPKESIAFTTNGNPSSGTATPSQEDEEDEPSVPITLTGPQPLVYEAQALLNQIISSKTSKLTQRVRDIPTHVLPFILARKSTYQAAANGTEINLSLNATLHEITVSGEREAVFQVVDTIKSHIEGFRSSLTSLRTPLPKAQHRLLSGKAADEIMVKTKCAVMVAKPEDPGNDIVVWGQPADLPKGLTAVMEQASSQHIRELPLPGPMSVSKQVLTYITRTQFLKAVSTAHPGVSIFTPPATLINGQQPTIDIVGERAAVDAAAGKFTDLFGKLQGATLEVDVDWLLHRVILWKNAKKLKQIHDIHNVQAFFSNDGAEQSKVLLVYDPSSASISSSLDIKKHLDDVSKEIQKMAKDAADVKTETITVDKKWHEAVLGHGRTTLNAIIGEDKTLSIKVGAEVSDPSTEDIIQVRGASTDVDGAVKEILRIVENAKNDEIVNSYSTEFDIDREYVGRVVGAHGTAVNKLREQLGVRVDVLDDVDDKEKEGGKKKKAVHLKSKIKITGRKENVEEAKKRILTQVERLADETSEVLKIPSQYHSSLIGQSGKYAIRLEEKYSVKITFPRQSSENGEGKTREQLKPDEVLVKGGKKGVAGAKAELLEALEVERESNQVLKFTVPNRAVARILGKGGASINEIKDNTGAQIDVEKGSDDTGSVTQITLRGTQKAITEAKAAILVISDSVAEETTTTVVVESKFHRSLIGPGGQGLKDLISRCGGPSDPKIQAGLIRFPRQGEPSDEVRLRGEPKLVQKLKTELEKAVAVLRDRTVLAVEIPASQHRALIGRGGQHLNEMQNRTGVQIQFPGSRAYSQVGDAENADELEDVDPGNIVKVTGPRATCQKVIEELKGQVKPPTPELVTASMNVPLKYYHTISQQGNFFRTLRNFGVQIEQSALPQQSRIPPRPIPSPAASARIDDAGDDNDVNSQWEVVPYLETAEEGESTWTLKGRDQAGLERAQTLLTEAIEQAKSMTHVGFLTLPDRSVFPRIVGTKGATVARLRNDTGADITVSKETNTIVIIGSEPAINSAKAAILQIVSNVGRSQRKHQES